MSTYTHRFDVRMENSFQSPIENFDDALQLWLMFKSEEQVRDLIMTSDDSTRSIIQSLIWSITEKEDE